jgi:hypothetical protein
MKNLLYRRTDDVERLQKVIGNTEQQFVGSLQRIRTMGEELEGLRGPPGSWLSHPIYKNINRVIIYAPGSSHTYIQQNHQDITTRISK